MIKSLCKKIYTIYSEIKKNRLKQGALHICIVYLVFGFLWIFYSDWVVHYLIDDKQILLLISTYKGFLFVCVTSVILYILLSILLKKADYAEKKLRESYLKITTTNEELTDYIQQLRTSEEDLRKQYDQIKEYDKKLSISENKYKTLISQMQLGFSFYEGNPEEKLSDYILKEGNDSFFRTAGFSREDVLLKKFSEIHEELQNTNYYKKLQKTLDTGEPTYFERYLPKADMYFEVIAYRPQIGQLVIIINDITTRKVAEHATKTSESNFRKLFKYSPDANLIIEEDRIVNCNATAIELLGLQSENEIIGNSPIVFVPDVQPNGEDSRKKLDKIYCDSLNEGKHKFEWWIKSNDGSLKPVEVLVTTVILNDKKVFHALCRDISEHKEFEEKLQYLSYHDHLTGLYNRRYYERELARLDHEEYQPLTITMADINGLKLINDSFGHVVGDEYIKKIAEVMKKACRPNDILCRLAGDEFVVLSANTNIQEAEQLVKKFKSLAKNEKVNGVSISISFGYETKNNRNQSLDEVMKKAEDFMYKRKLLESPSMRGKAIHTMITTLHEKNAREELHSRRVSEICESMGQILGMQEDEIRELKMTGLLHDIGKVAIDERILNKSGSLSADEWEEMKRHPEIGYRILSTDSNMSEMAEYVLSHHERWDGKGYPKGLKGRTIPLQSRIITIADAYDAMASERSYRNAMPMQYVIKELKENAGIQFDPELVELFIEELLEKKYDGF